jgi:hypothetical protein
MTGTEDLVPGTGTALDFRPPLRYRCFAAVTRSALAGSLPPERSLVLGPRFRLA